MVIGGIFGWLLRLRLIARLLGLPTPRYRVRVIRRIAIPMRDGVKLIADRYFPDTPPPHPVILIRSPYGRGVSAGAFGILTEFCARRFAEQGFGVVVQDVRGRFDSGSDFVPFIHERNDGWDTLDWLSQRDWCAGVGMWGSSYLGIVQWAAADHPAVKALMPTLTASDVYAVAFQDGIFNLDLGARWIAILNLQEQYKRRPLLATSALVTQVEGSAQRAFQHVPLIDADAQLPPGTVTYYRDWLRAQQDGVDLRSHFPNADAALVTAPTMLIGGWYDFFLRGLLNDYAALKAAGHTPHLTIGPWTHYSYFFLMLTTLSYGVRWFNATLRSNGAAPKPEPSPPVRLFILGSKQWRSFDEFPPPSTTRCWYLDNGERLDAVPGTGSPDEFTFNPASPPPMIGGAQFSIRAGAKPNDALLHRPDVLVYTAPALTAPLEIIGYVRAELYVKASHLTADFFARLCVVDRRGRTINICDGLARLSPQCGEAQPDGTVRLVIDMGATAYRFSRGERLRLLIAGSGHPRWTRNLGGDDPFNDTTFARIEQSVCHDLTHPSALILPVVGL